jgi:hypothetical protein
MQHVHVKPNSEGLIVRFPNDPSRILPAEGARVPWCRYWRKKWRDGDLVQIDDTAARSPKKKER